MNAAFKAMRTNTQGAGEYATIATTVVVCLTFIAAPPANSTEPQAYAYSPATKQLRNRLRTIAEQFNSTCTKQGRFYEAQHLSMQSTVSKEVSSLTTPAQLAEVCIWADSQPARAAGEGHYFSEVMEAVHFACVYAIAKHPRQTALRALYAIRKHVSLDGSHALQMDEVLFNFQVRSRQPFVYLFFRPSNDRTQLYEREVHRVIAPGWESLYSKFADQTKPVRCNVTFSIRPDGRIAPANVSIEGGSASDRPLIESWLKSLKVLPPPAGIKFTQCDFMAEF